MILQYTYAQIAYSLDVHWTDENGSSAIFRNIIVSLDQRHQIDVSVYLAKAEQLDQLVDKLYVPMFMCTHEYSAAPYNPKLPGQLGKAIEELIAAIDTDYGCICSDWHLTIQTLFHEVLDKLRDIMDVFLEEHAYRSKYRSRKRHLEQFAEETNESLMTFAFEDVLIQMTDISRLLDCLTERQRQRLVKHIFLKYTLQEIADQEGVGKSKVHRSVTEALRKIKELVNQ